MSTNGTQVKGSRSPSSSKDGGGGGKVATPTSFFGGFRNTITNGGASNNNRSSPVSPSRVSRQHEKEEMQNLNDRLVVYIDTVRRLEQDNSRLQSVITTYNENSTRDVSEIKSLYERELEDAKRLIDELAKEKAKFEISLNKANADAEEATAKLAKREKDVNSLEQRLQAAESQTLEYKSRYQSVQQEHARLKEEHDRLKPSHSDLEKQLVKMRKQLEEETLVRVDLENKNQTLKEDLQFKSQIYEKEVDQLRSSKRVEIEQVDVRLRDEYDSRLVAELQRIRDETESKISGMKDEVERRYTNKLVDSDANVKRLQQSATALKDEMQSYKTRYDEVSSELKHTQLKVANNENKTRDLEEKLRQAHLKYDLDVGEKDRDLNALRREMQELLLEYQELHDIKINLDMEIGAYRKLLESEEQRLNISSSASMIQKSINDQLSSSYLDQPGPSKNKKRKAQLVEQEDLAFAAAASASASVPQFTQTQVNNGVEIGDHDFEGKCVRLTNITDREISLANWTLKRIADGQEVEIRLSGKHSLKPLGSITIWSSNAIASPAPQNEFIIKQKWLVGDSMSTILSDNDAKEQSKRESRKVTVTDKKHKGTPSRTTTTTDIKVHTVESSSGGGSSSAVQKIFSFFKQN